MDTWETARRLLREYGKQAEQECSARVSFYKMEGDAAEAAQWRKIKANIAILRLRDG